MEIGYSRTEISNVTVTLPNPTVDGYENATLRAQQIFFRSTAYSSATVIGNVFKSEGFLRILII